MTKDDDDAERVAELERRIAALETMVRELTRGASARVEPPRTLPAIPEKPTPPAQRLMPTFTDPPIVRTPERDWESLIGRYGTLILATVAILAAVGTFIGWAIANGLLGPAQRVILGLIAAAGLAVAGMRLRKRERAFGTSLLGVALAMVHVCAWGAGPALHLVPTSVAFALAAVASAALALLAHLEDDEPLWSVGFTGAAIAPFVTSSRSGQMLLLALYGLGVLGTSGKALGERPWKVASRIFALAATLYVGSLMLGTERDFGPRLALGLPLALAFVGVLPWTSGDLRRDRLRALGALAGLAALRAAFEGSSPANSRMDAMLIGVAGMAWLFLVDQTRPLPSSDAEPQRLLRVEGDWVDAGLIPASFVIAALAALDATPRVNGLVLVGVTAALLLAVARHRAGSLRDAAVVTTVVAAVAALAQLQAGNDLTLTASLAVLGAACFAATLWRPSTSWTTLGTMTLGWTMLAAIGLLNDRPQFGYTPLLTPESGVAAAVFAGLLVAWRLARVPRLREVLMGGAVVWGFAWIHQELANAFSRTAAILLRVSYYAATSVAAVWIGRARRIPILRHVGLGLAVLAAGTALYSARNLVIGARIVADLVAAGFLLAIAYWYRKPGGSPQAPEPTR